MRRLPVLAALVLVAAIGASAWLAIDARSDPEPLPAAEHLPRDDDQTQQEESQEEPEPRPEDQSEEQQAATDEADEVGDEKTDAEVAEEPVEPEEADEEEEETVVEEAEPLDPADVVIAALDVERPIALAEFEVPPTLRTYIVVEGDTLSDIADQFGVTLDELIAANDLTSPDLVDVGYELILPIHEPAALRTYAPIEVAPRVTEGGILHGTIEDHERDTIDSAVIAVERTDSDVRLVNACIEGVLRSYIMGVELSETPIRVYWRADGGPLNTDRWMASGGLLESPRVAALLADLTGAELLWMRIGGVDFSFAVASMLDTEAQPNLDSCGA